MTNEQIKEFILETLADDSITDKSILLSEDYADAFKGVTATGQTVYGYERMITSLQQSTKMTSDEAMEYVSYNTLRGIDYIPDGYIKPVIIYELQTTEEDMPAKLIMRDINYEITSEKQGDNFEIVYQGKTVIADKQYGVILRFTISDVLTARIIITNETGAVLAERADIWRKSDLELAIPRTKTKALEGLLSTILNLDVSKPIENISDIFDVIAALPINWKGWSNPVIKRTDNSILLEMFYAGDEDLFFTLHGIENNEPFWGKVGVNSYSLHIQIEETEDPQIQDRYLVRANDRIEVGMYPMLSQDKGVMMRSFKISDWFSSGDVVSIFKELSEAKDFQTAYSKLRSFCDLDF